MLIYVSCETPEQITDYLYFKLRSLFLHGLIYSRQWCSSITCRPWISAILPRPPSYAGQHHCWNIFMNVARSAKIQMRVVYAGERRMPLQKVHFNRFTNFFSYLEALTNE